MNYKPILKFFIAAMTSSVAANAAGNYPRPSLTCDFNFEGTRPPAVSYSKTSDDRDLVGDFVSLQGQHYVRHENFSTPLSYQVSADFETRRVFVKVIDAEFGQALAEFEGPFTIGKKFSVRNLPTDSKWPENTLIECTAAE